MHANSETTFSINGQSVCGGLAAGHVWAEVIQLNSGAVGFCPDHLKYINVTIKGTDSANASEEHTLALGEMHRVRLPHGNYKLILDIQHCDAGYFEDAKAILHITDCVAPDPNATMIDYYTGGLRIKSIIDNDSLSGVVRKKTYDYSIAGRPGFSSGSTPSAVYNNFIVSKYNAELAADNPDNFSWEYFVRDYYKRQSYSNIPLATTKGSTTGYSRVTETEWAGTEKNGYTVYQFTDKTDYPDLSESENNYPIKPVTSRDYMRGELVKKEVYAMRSGVPQLVKRIENEYESILDTTMSVASLGFQGEMEFVPGRILDFDGEFKLVSPDYFTIPPFLGIYKEVSDVLLLTKTTETTVDAANGSKYLETVTYNRYSPLNFQVNKNTVFASADSTDRRITEIKYPADYFVSSQLASDSSMQALQILDNMNLLNDPVEQSAYVEKSGVKKLISGQVSQYDMVSRSVKQVGRVEVSQPVTPVTLSQNNSGVFNTHSLVQPALHVLKYDNDYNILEQKLDDNITQSYLWAYGNNLPVAQVVNATHASSSYTSFESDGKGNWDYSLGAASAEPDAPTGGKIYNLSSANIQRAALTSSVTYVLSYWLKNGGSVNLNGSSAGATALVSRSGWTLYQKELSGLTSLTISGSGKLDELRMFPKGSQMITYTYEPLVGVTSQSDVNNKITYYEYDGFNRLVMIRDENRNIIKQLCYTYYNDSTQPCLEINTNANWVNEGTPSCESGSGSYLTGHQLQVQRDMNSYSPTFNQTRNTDIGLNTTACPISADWQPTGNLRCATGSGYNTGVQEKEEQDQNPYSAQGTRWVSNGTNTTVCPVTADWATTGNYRCVTGSGYNTGAQEAEQQDQNPYSALGTRWVSNGTNTTACPITADWQATGNYRCVTGSGYNTGSQEKEEHDNNPYSAQGTRWVSNGTNTTACPVTADWATTGNYRCVTGSGYNTGAQEAEQHDRNPYSALGTRWVGNGTNTTACPITPDWQPTGTYQCVSGTGGFATGERQQQQLDSNPYSGLGYRWVSVGTNYTACPLAPSYTNTGNTRCVTNTGYNTGVQEVEQQDVNPYTGYGTRWVYGSVNYSACPVQEDWVNTGEYICIQGSGNYKTGEQDVEQYDQNPVTRAGYRWVSGGQNTSACPVTADWTNTSNYRCVTGSGYNTGQQERQQYDQNPYSGQGYRWVNVGSSSACPVTPDWATTGNYRCVTGSGYNTGIQEAEQYDLNPYSGLGTRWVSNGTNHGACPVAADWQPTGSNRCVSSGGYNTGSQERQELDNNPYSNQGYRWVNVGANPTACPVTADWTATGNYRCVTGSGYNTGSQEKQEVDNNPFSNEGYRWVSNGTNIMACPLTPDWVNQGSPMCETNSLGERNGYQIQLQHDQNPYSASGYRWINIGQNLTACPLPTYIYAKLTYENQFETFEGYVYADVLISFYSNAALTIPASLSGVMINYSVGQSCSSSYDDAIEGNGTYVYIQRMAMLATPFSCYVDYSLLTGEGYYIAF